MEEGFFEVEGVKVMASLTASGEPYVEVLGAGFEEVDGEDVLDWKTVRVIKEAYNYFKEQGEMDNAELFDHRDFDKLALERYGFAPPPQTAPEKVVMVKFAPEGPSERYSSAFERTKRLELEKWLAETCD